MFSHFFGVSRDFSAANRCFPVLFVDPGRIRAYNEKAVAEAAPAPHVPLQVSWLTGATQEAFFHVPDQDVQQDLSRWIEPL
jgi:hypothetical protein